MGKYPARAVQVMARIAEQAERDAFEMEIWGIPHDMDTSDTTNAICDAACITARDIKAKSNYCGDEWGIPPAGCRNSGRLETDSGNDPGYENLPPVDAFLGRVPGFVFESERSERTFPACN